MFDISAASVLETGIWAARFENTWYVLAPPRWANGLALSDHVRAEQVKLDSSGDVGDAGLAGLAGGEVAGFPGLAGAGPVRAVPDEGGGGEGLQQGCGGGEVGLLRGERQGGGRGGRRGDRPAQGEKAATVSVAAARACGKLIVSGGTPAAAAPIPMILQMAW